MITTLKQPSIKLIPTDPITNTTLIIYCMSNTGASVPYKSYWRKINKLTHKVEDINNHNGSSYRCSPLDLECVIEATVIFQHLNVKRQKTVQSNVVKISRQLKEKKNSLKQPIPTRISIDQLHVDVKVMVQNGMLIILPMASNQYQTVYSVAIMDIVVEGERDHHVFKMHFRMKFQQFSWYFQQLLGWKPIIKSQFVLFCFNSDINRDIILLSITECYQKPGSQILQRPHHHYNPTCKVQKQFQQKQQLVEAPKTLNFSFHSKNKSLHTLLPAYSNRQKIKVNQKMQLHKSITKINVNGCLPIKNMAVKEKQVQKSKQYLNIFQQSQQYQSLADTYLISKPSSHNNPKDNQKQHKQVDQPSINLRRSFQQLQRSFSTPMDPSITTSVPQKQSSFKPSLQLQRLKKQNDSLKRQNEIIPTLTKQNNTIKKKYHELNQQINRLEIERKVILTDKLRCEVNWRKQIQQKQYLKKQLQQLKQLYKYSSNPVIDRPAKSQNKYEVSHNQRKMQLKQRDKSPNYSFNNLQR